MSQITVGELNSMVALIVLIVLCVVIWRFRPQPPASADRVRASTICGADVQCGDVIGLGEGLGLTVERAVFDGEDGLLIGRAFCDEPIDNGRHGALRPGQPYAVVVTASGELSWIG